jgi:hypothetical protein
VRVGRVTVRLVGGRAVLRDLRPGRLVVRVTAAARGGVIYAPAVFQVTLPSRGAARVVRLSDL